MLDKIIKFSIKNKLIIGVFTIALVVWGVWSASRLPIDAVPDITDNQVQIITIAPTLAGQEVEQLITFPIEQSIANTPKLKETRSISRFGLSVVTAVFEENVDIYFARQLIGENLKVAQESIPTGLGTHELAPVSTGLGEVYQYIIRPTKESEHKYTAKDLREMQEWIVSRQLYGTPGVAEVNSFGGELKQYEVAVYPYRLKAMGISITDIFNALEQNNQNTGGAYIDKKPNAHFIRGIGLVTSLDDVRNICVTNKAGKVPVFIKDVADVRFGSAVRYGALTHNGQNEVVGGIVMMLKGENSNEVVKRIKEKLPTIQKSLPDDIVIEPYLDRTDLVGRTLRTVRTNLIEGALIVIFVLVLFLGNIRAGLIVASAIPLSMLFALGCMNVFGVSANLMSLGAIDFGLIVDGAVIVVEATLHHLGLRKSTHRLTQQEMDIEVYKSASKIRNSAAFGEIIILIVYIPILTLVGVEGKMFRPMAQTVGFAIFGALILSLTYIPMMSALFLSKNPIKKQTVSDKVIEWLQAKYQPLLEWAIRFKYAMIGIAIVVLIGTVLLFRSMGGEFIPQLQEGDYAFHCILPQGSSLSQSIETSMYASRLIMEFDEVKDVIGKTGTAEVPTDPMPPEATDMMVILKPQKEWTSGRSYRELGDAIEEKLHAIPGVFFERNQPIQMRFNELMTGIRQDVAVKIFGENLDSLAIYAGKVATVISEVEGTTAPQVERVGGLPQINIEYDRRRLANYGLNINDINDVVSTAFAGKNAGVVLEDERRFDLVVRLDTTYRSSIEDVSSLLIPTQIGYQVPLSQVANVGYKIGPAQISRENGKRRIVIGFNVSGRDVQSVVEEIQTRLDKEVKLPSGYYFTYGGQFENLQEASLRLKLAVPVSLLLIFVLLYFTFGSLKQAALIFTAIPMSAIGGVLALYTRGMPFSISAGVGFIALFGVAVLNGIVLISTFNQLYKEGITDVVQRVIQGTRIRLRPVLMTALVAGLGFMPMALSTSAGAEVQKPLATVVIGGLFTATILTLFLLPLLYIIFSSQYNFKQKMRKKIGYSAIIIGLLLFTQNAEAQQTAVRRITIDEAITIAKENNRGIKAADYELKAAKAISATSIELPKLDFDVQYGQYSGINKDNSFSIKQTIPFPTLFVAKRQLTSANVKAMELQRELSELELKNMVRTYYYQILFYSNNRSELQHLDSLYEDFLRVAQTRYRAGDTRKIDVSTAEAKRSEIALMVQQNEQYLADAYRLLQVTLNSSEPFEVAKEDEYKPLTIDNEILDKSSLAEHPSVGILYQQAETASLNKRVEANQALPDITIGYTNQSLIGVHNIDGVEQEVGSRYRFQYISLGISVPLTLWATSGKLRALEHQKQSALNNAHQQLAKMEAEVNSTLGQYRRAMERYHYFTEQALPNAKEITDNANLSYKTGEIGYLEYLYALQTATDIRLNYLQAIHEANQLAIACYSFINK